MTMEIHSVQSSLLSSFGYDEEEHKLQVTFNKGGTYVYSDVPEDVYESMKEADSVGKYFLAHIKDRYDFEKLY